MIEELVREFGNEELIKALYDCKGITDKSARNYLIFTYFKKEWSDTNRNRHDIVKEIAVRFDLTTEAVYGIIKDL